MRLDQRANPIVIRRFGQAPLKGFRYKTRPGSYAILIRDSKVLLTHQAQPEPEFQLPGGGIDPGETPIAALHREVLEETGWAISISRRVGAYRRFTYMPEYEIWAEKICHIYLGRPALKLGDPSEVDHCPVWVEPETAISLIASAGDAEFLSRVVR